ncbi:hypothetical protein C8R45DRAFT_1080626 [Mycena sanguinolenta]|nr:hypothetical protein C8R45DRAFT_1080626 [Mycena sanguinolenta]
MYLGTPEDVEEFKIWIRTLPDPNGGLMRWWKHKEMDEWLLPSIIQCLSDINPAVWHLMKATTNFGCSSRGNERLWVRPSAAWPFWVPTGVNFFGWATVGRARSSAEAFVKGIYTLVYPGGNERVSSQIQNYENKFPPWPRPESNGLLTHAESRHSEQVVGADHPLQGLSPSEFALALT